MELDIENFSKFISFKSISTDQSYENDLRQCCTWLTDYLASFCDSARAIETANKPVIVAQVGAGEPIIVYGHYDVQPAKFGEGWTIEPFVLQEIGDRLYGRGAQDNKGQLWYSIQAVKHLKKNNLLGRKVFFFIEGEEESGGDGSQNFLKSVGRSFFENAEVVLMPDAGTVSEDLECITLGVRGIASFTLRVLGPSYDLHSGIHGGLAPNPIHEAAQIVYLLTSQNGKNIPGFLDKVQEPTSRELELVKEFVMNASLYSRLIGLSKELKNIPCSPLALGLFHGIEVCGIQGGYHGPGIKNIIPHSAVVKVSMRTVANQKSDEVLDVVIRYIQNLDLKCALEFEDVKAHANPVKVNLDHPEVQKLARVLEHSTKNRVIFQWSGASIPIAEIFSSIGITPLIFGFGLEEDQIHGPDESFKKSQMEKGFQVMINLLKK
ncbi:MAG: M20/M25/M40 family metallo-hydrolase [Deltaproteobacteria bacterium]|nr:M20/M25/M40 family metallo-hydrolase [Deltaproteobacteria bacterium]